jgi:hypothetical protein
LNRLGRGIILRTAESESMARHSGHFDERRIAAEKNDPEPRSRGSALRAGLIVGPLVFLSVFFLCLTLSALAGGSEGGLITREGLVFAGKAGGAAGAFFGAVAAQRFKRRH